MMFMIRQRARSLCLHTGPFLHLSLSASAPVVYRRRSALFLSLFAYVSDEDNPGCQYFAIQGVFGLIPRVRLHVRDLSLAEGEAAWKALAKW